MTDHVSKVVEACSKVVEVIFEGGRGHVRRWSKPYSNMATATTAGGTTGRLVTTMHLLLFLAAVAFGQIQVDAPAGAVITVDGKGIGTVAAGTPGLLIANVAEGEHTVKVRAAGGSTEVTRVVRVRALETTHLAISPLSLLSGVRLQPGGGQRPRGREVRIATAQDHIAATDLPAQWKRALSSAVAGVSAFTLDARTGRTIKATFRCGSVNGAAAMVEKLSRHPAVDEITVHDVERSGGIVTIQLHVTFHEAR